MANTPILNLPVAVSLSGDEYLPLVQADTTKRAQVGLIGGGVIASAQSANTIYSGPASGSAALPTFRLMVSADLPTNPEITGNLTFLTSTAQLRWNASGAYIADSGAVTDQLYFRNAANGYYFDAAVGPFANDGAALGVAGTNMWSDVFLASGAVINWNSGDVTITHSANALAFAGASSGYTFDAAVAPATNDGAALGTASASWSDVFLAGGAVINWRNGGATITDSGAGTDQLYFQAASGGYYFDAVVGPFVSDGAALGAGSNMWSDLFLASGGVINFNNGNYTITHTAGDLAFSGIVTLPNTGLHLLDTNASHDLIVRPGSNLTADRTMTITTGDADRTLDISAASVTVSAFGATLVDDADPSAAMTTLTLYQTTTVTGSVSVGTSEVAPRLNITGTSAGTITINAATGYPAACEITICNNSTRGWTIAPNGVTSWTLYPTQVAIISRTGSTWSVENNFRWQTRTAVTFYVNHSTGSNSNDGLTTGSAFATIQKAIDVIEANLDCLVNGPTIKVTTVGTFTENNVVHTKQMTGNHVIYIEGDPVTPSNCVWQCGSGLSCFTARDWSGVILNGFRFQQASGSGATLVSSSQHGIIDIWNIDFGNCAGGIHMSSVNGGSIGYVAGAVVSISGTTYAYHWYMASESTFIVTGITSYTVAAATFTAFLGGYGGTITTAGFSFTGAGAGSGSTGAKAVIGGNYGLILNGLVLPGNGVITEQFYPLGTGTLGTNALPWATLYIGSTGFIDFGGGDGRLTHATGVLRLTGMHMTTGSSDFLGVGLGTTTPTVQFTTYAAAAEIAQFVCTNAVGNLGYITLYNNNGANALSLGAIGSGVSTAGFFQNTTGTVIEMQTAGAAVTADVRGGGFTATSKTIGIGYRTGAGGTVTQATSKSTGVTLNAMCGEITMNNAALAAGATAGFPLTNSAIASASDMVLVNIKSGGTINSYRTQVSAVAAGSARIEITNTSGGSLSEAVVLSFAVIKGVTS